MASCVAMCFFHTGFFVGALRRQTERLYTVLLLLPWDFILTSSCLSMYDLKWFLALVKSMGAVELEALVVGSRA